MSANRTTSCTERRTEGHEQASVREPNASTHAKKMACPLHTQTNAPCAPKACTAPAVCVPAAAHAAALAQADAERTARASLAHELSSARADVARLQAELARLRGAATLARASRACSPVSAPGAKPGPRALSDCSSSASGGLPAASKPRPPKASGGVRKRTTGGGRKERASKPKVAGQSRYWTPDEHRLFLEALNQFGHKDLRAISGYVGTRNMTQVRTHSQKYFMRLMREAKRQNPATEPVVAALIEPAPEAAKTKTALVAPAEERETREGANGNNPGGDKYSVPNTCGMTLLCLVGQDTLTS